MSTYRLINCNCLDFLGNHVGHPWDCLFADPPDNIGLKYDGYNDRLEEVEYKRLLRDWLYSFYRNAKTVWFSFNTKWTFEVGKIVSEMQEFWGDKMEAKMCVQTFTFGQHNHHDLGNNHRPLLRLRHENPPMYPGDIRVPSWRQLNGDKRADPRGRVPGDVFDFPRVTGNSKQRRAWHPTQLHEGLVERCVRLTTKEGDSVLDPFGGTGTTLRVCKSINRSCTLTELDPAYCSEIAKEHCLDVERLQ